MPLQKSEIKNIIKMRSFGEFRLRISNMTFQIRYYIKSLAILVILFIADLFFLSALSPQPSAKIILFIADLFFLSALSPQPSAKIILFIADLFNLRYQRNLRAYLFFRCFQCKNPSSFFA